MRHWGFCLILITVVKKSRDYGPRGKSLLYYIPHIPHIPNIPHIPDIPHRKVAKLKSEKCGKRESGKNSFLTKSMVNKV